MDELKRVSQVSEDDLLLLPVVFVVEVVATSQESKRILKNESLLILEQKKITKYIM